FSSSRRLTRYSRDWSSDVCSSDLMTVSRPDPDGKEHILQFAMENWWITDAEAFYNHNPSKLVIDCMEDTHTLAITLAHKEKISQIGRAACRESAYKSLVSQCVRTR